MKKCNNLLKMGKSNSKLNFKFEIKYLKTLNFK